MMRVLAIVPARKGSKRFPGKNTRPFAGRPLWYWSYRQALEVAHRVVITSDDPEIYEKYSANGPIVYTEKRPEALAQDTTRIEDVISELLPRHEGFDVLVLLNPTHPLRRLDDLEACIDACSQFPSCTGVRKDFSYTVDEGVRYPALNEQGRVPRLVATGSIYAVRVPAFLERKQLMITGNVNRGLQHIEEGPHYDINTEEDFVAAEAVFEYLRLKNLEKTVGVR